ncbi:hypothetical protein SE956_02405 [Escherichia coli]|nr:hypothetical protein [Escherichia coli]
MNEVKTKASLDSPVFTGTPMTPTPPDDASGLETVNAAFVRQRLAALVGSSPEALDTLNELAEALGNDPSFATTMMNALAGKQPLSPVLTALGNLPSDGSGFPGFTGDGQCSLVPVSEKGNSCCHNPQPKRCVTFWVSVKIVETQQQAEIMGFSQAFMTERRGGPLLQEVWDSGISSQR